MRTTLRRILCVWAALCLAAATAWGQTGAKTDGNWIDPLTWTGGAAPGSGDDVYIGSAFPGGAAPTATVTLTANQSAANLYLGYGADGNGTLNLADKNLTVGNQLYIGYNGGKGAVLRGAGSLTAPVLVVDSANDFTFGAKDYAQWLVLSNNSQASTAAVGNVSTEVRLYKGSSLTLGDDMYLMGNFTADDGSAMTLRMGGHLLNVHDMYIGWNSGGTLTMENRGALRAGNLYVGGQTFNFGAADSAAYYKLRNSTSATAATGNITHDVQITKGSKLTLGADMRLASSFTADDGTAMTLDMGGHSLRAGGNIVLGYSLGGPLKIENRGALYAPYLSVGNQSFNFIAADSVGYYGLRDGTSTTAATSNITQYVDVRGNSRLTLGADVAITSIFEAQDNSIVNAARHSISADRISLGYAESSRTSLIGGGAVYVNQLLMFRGSTATFHPGGVIDNSIALSSGSVLTLLQSKGDSTGLTFNGRPVESLYLDQTSHIVLDFGDNDKPSWIFRWKDGDKGRTYGALANLIDAGRILINAPHGYNLYASEGYIYVGNAVPVPGTILGLAQLGGIAAAVVLWRRRRSSLAK